jgi:hypothetical protein
MALRSWDVASSNNWMRLAKLLDSLRINIKKSNIPWMADDNEEKPSSWAEVIRKLLHLRMKPEEVGGSKETWCAQIWDLNQEEWRLVWEGENPFWKHLQKWQAAGLLGPHACPCQV